MGRKPLAQEVKRKSGTYRLNPNRENKSAPTSDGKEPDMPDWFNEDETLKWLELAEDLSTSGVLSKDCRELMIAYCTAFGGWMKARRAVEATGIALVQKEEDGSTKIKSNPFCIQLHKYRDTMNRLLPEFGLTPSSRGKLKSMNTSEDSDPFGILSARYGMN